MDGKVIIGTELDSSMIDKQIDLLQDKLEGLTEEYEVIEKAEPFESQTKELIKLGKEIRNTKKELSKLVQEKEKMTTTGFSNIIEQISGVGNSVEKVTKKVGRWALAVFGIRSAYMGIRNAINTIASQDEKLAADINYLKTALAYTLEPIVRTIVELMKQIVFYIGYIIKAWTGRDIFARANKNLKSAAKSAKQLKKELTTASFDEMNILNDTSSSGGGSTSSPSFNLSDMEAPKWLQWIVKNKKPLLAIISGLTAGILAWKLGLKAIKSFGIGIAVAGLVYAIEGLIDFLKDPAFENFIKILEGITVAVIGVAVAIAAWPVALAAAVALIVIELVKHFDEIKGLFNKLLDWMDKNFLGTLKNLFGPLGEILYAPFEAVVKMVKTLFESFYGGIKQIIEGIVKIFNGDFLGGIKDIFGGLLNVLLAPFNALVEGVKTVIGRLKTFFGDLLTWMKDKFISPLTSKLGGIINKLKDILGLQQKTNVTGGGGAGSFGGGTSGSRAMGGIFYPSLLPKLAVGGIINNPGAGVPYHGAVIGERGAEAVVPLTQSEQMELLGESIGRYVTINATIPVYAYNRQVDRQIQIIRAEDDFASNR